MFTRQPPSHLVQELPGDPDDDGLPGPREPAKVNGAALRVEGRDVLGEEVERESLRHGPEVDGRLNLHAYARAGARTQASNGGGCRGRGERDAGDHEQ